MLTRNQIMKSVRHEMAYYTSQGMHKDYGPRDGGIAPAIGTIVNVSVEYSDDGTCEGITIYAAGDVIEKSHRYGSNVLNCVNIVRRYLEDSNYTRVNMISDIADAIIAELQKYVVVTETKTDEFIEGKYPSLIDAFKAADDAWGRLTKAERKVEKVSVRKPLDEYSYDEPCRFSSDNTLEEIVEILKLSYEAYGNLPSEEVHRLCRFAEKKDIDYDDETGTGYTSDEREASLKKACEILGVTLPTYEC